MTSCSGCVCIQNIDDDTKFCGVKATDGYQYGCDSSCCTTCDPTPHTVYSSQTTPKQVTSTQVSTNQYANPLLVDTTGEVKMYSPEIIPIVDKAPDVINDIKTKPKKWFQTWWFWIVVGGISIIVLFIIIYILNSRKKTTANVNKNNYDPFTNNHNL